MKFLELGSFTNIPEISELRSESPDILLRKNSGSLSFILRFLTYKQRGFPDLSSLFSWYKVIEI